MLHIEHYSDRNSDLLAFEQDEGNYGGQQIWWVEPLCDYYDEKGTVYSIINPSSRRVIDMPPEEDANAKEGRTIHCCTHHAETWQRWRIRPVADDKDGKVTLLLI